MNQQQAGEILRANVTHLQEPLKSAVEFTLETFYQPPSASELAKNLLASVPFEVFMANNLNEVNPELKSKIDAAYLTLMNDKDTWYGLRDLPHEIWRDVRDYEGLYQVSNYGRIKSFRRNAPMIFIRYKDAKGYFSVGLKKRNVKAKYTKAHQIVAQAFIPNLKSKPQVNHIDGNKLNNRVGNLEWVTQKENIRHAYNIGLGKSGCENHNAKLTTEQVKYIREVCVPRDEKFSFSALAKELGISVSTVERIYNRKTYKNIT